MAVILVAIHCRALLAQDQGSLKCEPSDAAELIRRVYWYMKEMISEISS
jgi:hypothetical protein